MQMQMQMQIQLTQLTQDCEETRRQRTQGERKQLLYYYIGRQTAR